MDEVHEEEEEEQHAIVDNPSTFQQLQVRTSKDHMTVNMSRSASRTTGHDQQPGQYLQPTLHVDDKEKKLHVRTSRDHTTVDMNRSASRTTGHDQQSKQYLQPTLNTNAAKEIMDNMHVAATLADLDKNNLPGQTSPMSKKLKTISTKKRTCFI